MNMKDFLEVYKNYATDTKCTPQSAESYVSYLRGACKNLPGIHNNLNLIAASTDSDIKSMYAEQINAEITTALKSGSCPVKSKTLRNYKSAVNLLIAFLSDTSQTASNSTVSAPVLISESEYTRKDLRTIFLSRLKTQDRLSYSYGVFAVRILCKIAAKHKIKLFNQTVENIKFLYGPDKKSFFRLKEIDKLIIATDGNAYIEVKGKTYPLYTETYHKGKGAGFEIANVKTLRSLSLDHDTPLVKALELEIKAMNEYKKLSDDVMNYMKSNAVSNASDFSKSYFNHQYPYLNVSEASVLQEISNFLKDMQLTIMHTSYNSSKNKN
ncbi:MAG: hypothetical protein IJF19_02530 [Clostridia bacterium]|nr:hypothetical protein [Clostridia bacterium]